MTAQVSSLGPIDDAPEVLHPDAIVDGGRIERAVREILTALGEDPTRDGLSEPSTCA